MEKNPTKNSIPLTSTSKRTGNRVICLLCFQAVSITHIPLGRLGSEWEAVVKRAEAEGIECFNMLSVCANCYKKVWRSNDGYIRGYRMRNGKTAQYVEESLLGGDSDSGAVPFPDNPYSSM